MKKLTLMMGVAGLALASLAAVNDTLISFSTPGPDTYLDGTKVRDGECYALVWSQDGVFEGVKADGTAVDANDRVVLVAPVAKDGRCPDLVYQVAAATAEALEGGRYGVYLLDTRRTVAGETVVGLNPETGRLDYVKSYASATDPIAATDGIASAAAAKAVDGAAVAEYVEVAKPVVAIEVTSAVIRDGDGHVAGGGLLGREGDEPPERLREDRRRAGGWRGGRREDGRGGVLPGQGRHQEVIGRRKDLNMKLRLMMGVCALAAATALGADVMGRNVCGLMNVPSDAKVTMIAVPWVTVGGEADAMKVADLVKTDTLSAGDELYYYDGSVYRCWKLQGGAWQPTTVTLKDAKGNDLSVQTPDASYALPRGKGLFLVRQDATKEIWLYGQHSTAPISVAVAAGTAGTWPTR